MFLLGDNATSFEVRTLRVVRVGKIWHVCVVEHLQLAFPPDLFMCLFSLHVPAATKGTGTCRSRSWPKLGSDKRRKIIYRYRAVDRV